MTDEEKTQHHSRINETILSDWRTLGLTDKECMIAADLVSQLYATLGMSLMLTRATSLPELRTALVSSAVSLGMLKICDGTAKALDWDLQADRRREPVADAAHEEFKRRCNQFSEGMRDRAIGDPLVCSYIRAYCEQRIETLPKAMEEIVKALMEQSVGYRAQIMKLSAMQPGPILAIPPSAQTEAFIREAKERK